MFLGEIFQILTQTINGWPDPTRPEPQKNDPTRVKIFDPDPSLALHQKTILRRQIVYGYFN